LRDLLHAPIPLTKLPNLKQETNNNCHPIYDKDEKEEENEDENEDMQLEEEKKITKKEKKQARHDAFMQKLNFAYAQRTKETQRKEESNKKKQDKEPKKKDPTEKEDNQKQEIKFEGSDLYSTLVALEEEQRKEKKKKEREKKPMKTALSLIEEQKLMGKEIIQFQQVISLPAFQQDPLETIKQHLTNTMAAQKKQGDTSKKEKDIYNKHLQKTIASKKASLPVQRAVMKRVDLKKKKNNPNKTSKTTKNFFKNKK